MNRDRVIVGYETIAPSPRRCGSPSLLWECISLLLLTVLMTLVGCAAMTAWVIFCLVVR